MLPMEYAIENGNHLDMGRHLVEKLLFLSRIDGYIDGAQKQGNKQAELSLQILGAVEKKNTELLQDFLISCAGTC